MAERNTKTKLLITEVFEQSFQPLSLKTVFTAVKKKYPDTAFSTVYRVIKNLEQEKKVVPVDWRQRGSVYEWADRAHHHHLTCEVCGKVTDIDDHALGFKLEKLTDKTGFLISTHSIEITGVCQACQSRNGKHTKGKK